MVVLVASQQGKSQLHRGRRKFPDMQPSNSVLVHAMRVPEGCHSHGHPPMTNLSSSAACPSKIPPPPVGTIAITTDEDSSNISDLSPESIRLEKMISLMSQKTIILVHMVLGLSSQLSRAQCEKKRITKNLDVATTHIVTMSRNNKLPEYTLTEAQDEKANNEEACVNKFIVQETTVAEEMAKDGRDFQVALLVLEQDKEKEEVVSTTHILVHNAHLQRYKNGLANFNRVMNQAMGGNNYSGSTLGKRLYGAAAALNPQSSLKNLEVTASLVHAALLADAGINTKCDQIAKNVPSATTFKELIVDAATNSTFSAAEEIIAEAARLFLLCNKGAKKTSNSHFVKLLCWWCDAENTVKTPNLDANDTDGTSKKCAKAIRHALQKLFGRG
jgi:hypothetical protein